MNPSNDQPSAALPLTSPTPHVRRSISLVVIDPLATFMAGRSENDASSMLATLTPLQRLTTLGISVLVLHHPGKDDPPVGQAARGSGALSGFVDILIEMRWYRHAVDDDRRRRLHAFSRYEEIPRQHVIELTADGTDYLSRGSFQDEEFAGHWQLLAAILAEAPHKLTRLELREQWPDQKVPDDSTVYRWLERAHEQGLVRKDGKGQRNDPFRYRLPAREDQWRQDPLAWLKMPELFQPPPPPSEHP